MFQHKTDRLKGKESLLQRLEANDPHQTTGFFDTYPMLDEDMQRLIVIVQNNTHLTYLSLFDCRISRALIEPLLRAVLTNKHLEIVNIDKFEDYPESSQRLIQEVEQHLTDNRKEARSLAR